MTQSLIMCETNSSDAFPQTKSRINTREGVTSHCLLLLAVDPFSAEDVMSPSRDLVVNGLRTGAASEVWTGYR